MRDSLVYVHSSHSSLCIFRRTGSKVVIKGGLFMALMAPSLHSVSAGLLRSISLAIFFKKFVALLLLANINQENHAQDCLLVSQTNAFRQPQTNSSDRQVMLHKEQPKV